MFSDSNIAISDLISELVTGLVIPGAAPPYFMHGHFLEIAGKLMELDSATEQFKYKKYPLVALIHDFSEIREHGKPT